MDEVVELENVENVCRLCLASDDPKSSIFEADSEAEPPLATKIQACLSIQISVTDRLSTLICANCTKNVNQWHTFRESCLRSQDKLHQWLSNHLQSTPAVVTIKDEPVDLDFYEDKIEVLSETSESESHVVDHVIPVTEVPTINDVRVEDVTKDSSVENVDKDKENDSSFNASKTSEKDSDIEKMSCTLKTEPDDYDTDCTIEIESVTGSEFIMSPLESGRDDTVMEADSTQKSGLSNSSASKKKIRRGPHTHFRGTRVFKQKCKHCQINLHSKYSYQRHMERFHSSDLNDSAEMSQLLSDDTPQDEEEMIEDLEDELVSMEKDSPLTQVQQSIISQLKTFSCYSCQESFTDRRSTLSHIRQHMPDLRPYTCVACLTEFPDRSMYKMHCGASFECAMKIALVVPKHGQEKYFTCNMCLRPLPNRKELLSHLSKHSDKQYEELMSPTRSPPKLKPMAPLPQVPKTEPSPTKAANPKIPVIPRPYKNGDPAHNHMCDLCGMIYRYRPNMLKHRELCSRLLPGVRTSYKCAHCGMTFLVFKKFHSHVTLDHKKKEFTCSRCNAKFRSPSDYLTHHESHRTVNGESVQDDVQSGDKIQSPLKQWDSFEQEVNANKTRISSQKYSCALCGQEFPSRAELSEHRNLHLKVKIYSCVICRSMFSSAGALEIHMKDHGIEDPNERNANSSCVEYGRLEEDAPQDTQDNAQNGNSMNNSTASDPGTKHNECDSCGKIFSNYANLRRHIRNIHKEGKERFDCAECPRFFKSKELYDRHAHLEHKAPKTMFKCPKCPKSFVFHANLNFHCQSAHSVNPQAKQECEICGKVFLEESSLKIHKGWHNRANSRLNSRYYMDNSDHQSLEKRHSLPAQAVGSPALPTTSAERPARARKTFPNPPPTRPQGEFKCQVCDDRFAEVVRLKEHLWDVHCARNKPEKSFSGDELQCELCTNVFPDQETLKIHMQWHKANPILSDLRKSIPCEICGKHYSSKKVLWKHKKLHKATTVANMKFQSLAKKSGTGQFLCTVCRKVFSSNQSLQRHKVSFHSDPLPAAPAVQPAPVVQNVQSTASAIQNGGDARRVSTEEPKLKKVKIEQEDEPANAKLAFVVNVTGAGKKPVMCHLCKKLFPNMSILYKHKQMMHKQRVGKLPNKVPMNECVPLLGTDGRVSCNVCCKQFPGISNLRQHFTIKHKNSPKYTCHIDGCEMVFNTPVSLKNHEALHTSMIFCCNLCDRHVFSRPAMTKHMLTVHNTIYEAESNKSFHREADLRSYEVQDAVNATCPKCKIKYPNNRAMKIHYFKFHETAD